MNLFGRICRINLSLRVLLGIINLLLNGPRLRLKLSFLSRSDRWVCKPLLDALFFNTQLNDLVDGFFLCIKRSFLTRRLGFLCGFCRGFFFFALELNSLLCGFLFCFSPLLFVCCKLIT